MSLSIYHTLTHSLGRKSERRIYWDKRETIVVERSSLCFWVLLLVLILSLRNLRGFLLYGFLEENSLYLLSLVFISMHVILSFKDPKIMLGLNDKNRTWYQS